MHRSISSKSAMVALFLNSGFLISGCTSAGSETAAESGSVVVYGAINTIPISADDAGGVGSLDMDAQLVDGGSCRSRQGYDDIAEGSQVTIRDAKGEIIAVGALQAGIQDGSEEYTARDFQLFDLAICSFAFSIEAPAGKGFYTISVGNANRGEHTYSEEELAEGVYLVLGE